MYANYGGHKYEREHELYRVFLKQHCTILLQITRKKSANICACLIYKIIHMTCKNGQFNVE